jgi:hypothetical protein
VKFSPRPEYPGCLGNPALLWAVEGNLVVGAILLSGGFDRAPRIPAMATGGYSYSALACFIAFSFASGLPGKLSRFMPAWNGSPNARSLNRIWAVADHQAKESIIKQSQ